MTPYKKKIVILTQYFQNHEQAGISLISDFAHDAQNNGYTVAVVCGRYSHLNRQKPIHTKSDPADLSSPMVIRVFSGFEKNRNLVTRAFSFIVFSVTCFYGLAKAGRGDILYVSSPPPVPLLSGWLWGKLTGMKLVPEIRDLWPRTPEFANVIRNRIVLRLLYRIERFIYVKADGIVARTYGIRDYIARVTGPQKPIVVARGAVETSLYVFSETERHRVRDELGWTDKIIAIYAGTIGYLNDVETIVRAAAALPKRKNVHIYIIGDGAKRHELQTLAQSLGVSNVSFWPPMPKRELISYLVAADIGICPLLNGDLLDGAVPTKLLDYLAARLPVVAANLKELSSIVQNNDCGLLYDPGDPTDLAKSLVELASDSDRRAQTSANGFGHVTSEFDMTRRNARVIKFLESLSAS